MLYIYIVLYKEHSICACDIEPRSSCNWLMERPNQQYTCHQPNSIDWFQFDIRLPKYCLILFFSKSYSNHKIPTLPKNPKSNNPKSNPKVLMMKKSKGIP